MDLRAFISGIGVFFVALSLLSTTAHSCEEKGTVLEVAWEGDTQSAGVLGAWRIPLSPRHPDILTEARVLLEFEPTREVRALFFFPDPLPYGIPFSFQKLEMSWYDGSSWETHLRDWSEDCSGPGRSLFPGQSWGTAFDSGAPRQLRGVRLKLWGARN